MSNEAKTVVVLGMHRSGTSMVGNVLKNLGIDMGKRLAKAKWTNPLGHFEDNDFVDLNSRILRLAGGSWDKPPDQDKIREQQDAVKMEIVKLVQGRNSQLWGWKDPRTSLTMELYLPYLTNAYFIVCHRNIRAISRSLRRRDQLDLRSGERLTRIYQERIEDFFKINPDLPRLQLSYESSTCHPETAVKGITKFLDIQPRAEAFEQAIKAIMSQKKIMRISKWMRLKRLLKTARNNPLLFGRTIMDIIRYRSEIKKEEKADMLSEN